MSDPQAPDNALVKRLIKCFFEDEYTAPVDRASLAMVPDSLVTPIRFVCSARGRVCGVSLALQVLDTVLGAQNYQIISSVADGVEVDKDQIVLEILGPVQKVFPIQRVLLFLLENLTRIATYTSRWVEILKDSKTRLRDTSFSPFEGAELEKYAVSLGGAVRPEDNVIIVTAKHLQVATSIADGLGALRLNHPGECFEVETDCLEQVDALLTLKVAVLRLLNMTPSMVRQVVEHRDTLAPQTKLQVSGIQELSLASAYGATGVDYLAPSNLLTAGTEIPFRMELVSF